MFNRKIMLLLAGYIAGSVVNSLYNEKKGSQLKKEIKVSKDKGEDSCKAITDTFIETQKNFLDGFKSKVMSQENKEFYNKKKAELKDFAADYKVEGDKIVKDLKSKGKGYLDEAKTKAQELYNQKKSDIEKMKDEAPEKVEGLKSKLKESFDNIKGKLK